MEADELKRRLADAERRAAELQAILESIGDAVYIGGREGITLANQVALDQLGFKTREDLNRHIGVLAEEIQTRDPETDAPIPADEQPFARALAGERVVREVRVRHRLTGTESILRCSASPVILDGQIVGAVAVNSDINDQKRAEAMLRESEERQAFLLELADTLRQLRAPDAIMEAATRLLRGKLGANRCAYYELEDVEYVIRGDATDGVPSLVGRYPVQMFGSSLLDMNLHGRSPIVVDDVTAVHDATEREGFAAIHVGAYIGVMLVRQGVFVAGLTVHSRTPRTWSASDVKLTDETAERTWAAVERARAEAALRDGEARFRQFAEASSGALWIRNADTLDMEYASPSIATIYGVEPDAFLGDVRGWAATILPEDRDAALDYIERARRGEAVVHEFRIQRPSDRAFRWIRNTDFPLYDTAGRVQRIGGIAEDITDARLAVQHQGVLLAELQHRVRNIMAIVQAMIERTGKGAASVSDYATLMEGRLFALSRVQALLTRAANVGVGLATLIRDEVDAQASHAEQYVLAGPDVVLSPKAAEVMTLAVHELSTNALKYGALSAPRGLVNVSWDVVEKNEIPWLTFDWSETGAPERIRPADAPLRRGFGSELIQGRIPYELAGRGTLVITAGGAQCHLEFPLQTGASVLETGAPQPAAVFGGALDMSGEPDLDGRCVLVVEDEYYLAADAARALRGAGADVIGPSPSEASARAELALSRPDAVLLDINLGAGPSFGLAETLRSRGIPFVFITGYDKEAIPPEFDGVERLQKPVSLRQTAGAIARVLAIAEQPASRSS